MLFEVLDELLNPKLLLLGESLEEFVIRSMYRVGGFRDCNQLEPNPSEGDCDSFFPGLETSMQSPRFLCYSPCCLWGRSI
jgi:hypothetical protein